MAVLFFEGELGASSRVRCMLGDHYLFDADTTVV
jgi:hypothetical protein